MQCEDLICGGRNTLIEDKEPANVFDPNSTKSETSYTYTEVIVLWLALISLLEELGPRAFLCGVCFLCLHVLFVFYWLLWLPPIIQNMWLG